MDLGERPFLFNQSCSVKEEHQLTQAINSFIKLQQYSAVPKHHQLYTHTERSRSKEERKREEKVLKRRDEKKRVKENVKQENKQYSLWPDIYYSFQLMAISHQNTSPREPDRQTDRDRRDQMSNSHQTPAVCRSGSAGQACLSTAFLESLSSSPPQH